MDMDMSMGMAGMPLPQRFPIYYYIVVGSAVGIATLVNFYNHVLYIQRLFAARAGSQTPAKPKSYLARCTATLFALAREAFNFSISVQWKDEVLRLPTIGRLGLVLANTVVLVILCLFGLDLSNQYTREDVAYRCAFVTLAQLPLILLLSGKNNMIGYLVGISYERLNWLHRWCARGMLLTATLHMSYFFSAWAPYNFIGNQIKNNTVVWKGLAAWCTLAWIVFSSMTPIRGWSYEFFVIQHITSFLLFLVFIYLHIPPAFHVYIWISIALFCFDRGFRVLRLLYANISMLRSSAAKQPQTKGFWACKADLESLPHDTTRIIIQNPPISWSPGQHVFLSCHSIAPLQSHPFTISSIPADGRMEFLVKAQAGGTRRFFDHARKTREAYTTPIKLQTVMIEGPYGCHRPMRQFDSVILLAGGTGISFTFPLLRDIIEGWKENSKPETAGQSILSLRAQRGAATRYVRFAWVIKSKDQLDWFSNQLSCVCSEFDSLQERFQHIKLELRVYVTCDDSFTQHYRSLLDGISEPLSSSTRQRRSKHGPVELRRETQLEKAEDDAPGGQKGMREFSKEAEEQYNNEQKGCGPEGTCCCRSVIDENSASDGASVCCCGQETTRSSSAKLSLATERLSAHPAARIYSGRPRTRGIIRKALEQAMGESAVVVCGPPSLVANVKQDVCSLSDERAVHKGTGAQGIYLHTESFRC